jgi:excisionase family DNA binding protein
VGTPRAGTPLPVMTGRPGHPAAGPRRARLRVVPGRWTLNEIVPGDSWHTVQEAAALLKMSDYWIRDRIKDHSLTAVKITDKGRGEYRISDTAIAALMAHLAARGQPDGNDPQDGEATG